MSIAPRTAGIVAGLGLMAALAGCGDGDGNDTDTSGDNGASSPAGTSAPTQDEGSTGKDEDGDTLALVTAGQTALDEVDEGTVLEVESEEDGTVWEVGVALSDGSVQVVETSADGQDIQSGPDSEDTDSDDKAENKELLDGADLDYEEAAKRVLDARSGTITELELDDHQVGVVWEADVHTDGPKYEVKIDASSGDVVANESDS